MDNTTPDANNLVATRIAVYDDMLSAPRIIDVQPSDIASYIEQIAAKTYEFAQAKGSTIPYTVIREVCENFIHANFKDPCVSIFDNGNTIRFTDQGPGISDKQRAQLPGFTSATSEMRQYIRGVGSGFPQIREYLRFSNGRLIIEDNLTEGTVVTIAVDPQAAQANPVVYREQPQASYQGTGQRPINAAAYEQPYQTTQPVQQVQPLQGQSFAQSQGYISQTAHYNETPAMPVLSERESDILVLADSLGPIGPTEVHEKLGIAISTAHRDLKKLEESGLLETPGSSKKKRITDFGLRVLNGQG